MKIVLPIAGRGSRFKKEAERNPEFNKPKPIINTKGYPMVRWATGSLPFVEHKGQHVTGEPRVTARDLVFVALREHKDSHAIDEVLKSIYGDDVNIVFIDEVTRGAAETVLKAKEYINNDEPLLVSDSDHFLDGQALAQGIKDNPGIDGLIPVFKVEDKNPKWSYSKTDESGYVRQVAEKNPISEWANIGAYYFGKGRDFVAAAEEMINNAEYTNNEFYLAPVYNKLIRNGAKIKLVHPRYVYGLGTPADYEFFLNNTNYSL